MKAHSFTKYLYVALGLLLFLPFQNCSEQRFSVDSTSLGSLDCRDELQQLTTPVEMVFVVDTSGSNDKTDPAKMVRAGSIQAFFDAYKAKDNFKWSVIHFSNSRATTLAANANSSVMASALNTLFAIQDGGNTPYKLALEAAQSAVKNDPAPAANKKYVVIFWSDGMPEPAISDADLTSNVLKLVEAQGGSSVSLSTVYYGPVNTDASNRLNYMADIGKGNFLDTNSLPPDSVFAIEDFIKVPGVICE